MIGGIFYCCFEFTELTFAMPSDSLDYLKEPKSARMMVPLKGDHSWPLDCVARLANAPFVETVFLPEDFPLDQVDREGEFQISFEADGEPHALVARIETVLGPDRLKLLTLQTLVRTQKREYFRIDVFVKLKYRRVDAERKIPKRVQDKINLSGGGIWFPVQEALDEGETLAVEITLSEDPPKRVFALAEVIRMTGEKNARGVAVKFVEIDPEARNEVVTFCFAEQRRQLRKRLRIEETF